jgi:hypothetical protein
MSNKSKRTLFPKKQGLDKLKVEAGKEVGVDLDKKHINGDNSTTDQIIEAYEDKLK